MLKSLYELSDADKQLLLSSLPFISSELDLFVIKFYSYFLKTDAVSLFHKTHMEQQYRMFHASLGVIITHIDNPEFLEEHLNSIVSKHASYGVKNIHTEYFVEAFMNALNDIFGKNFKTYKELWYIVIRDIMNYFALKLVN